MRAVPLLCEFYPAISLTTEEKHGKSLVRVAEGRLYKNNLGCIGTSFVHKYTTYSYTRTYKTNNTHNKTSQTQVESNVAEIPKIP